LRNIFLNMAAKRSSLGLNSHPAIPGFARLIAAGLMGRDECLDALAEGQDRDARIALAHALTDATLDMRRARARTERAIRAALAPLLAARAPAAALRAAAHETNRAHGHRLRQAEVEAITAALVWRQLGRAH